MCWSYIPKFSCGHTGAASSIVNRCDSWYSNPRKACTAAECRPSYNNIDRKCNACDAKDKEKNKSRRN